MKWQPIETAPTDGTRILLRGMGGKIADGHYGQPDGYANPKQFVWPYIHANPTHWRPLPEPPESAAAPAQADRDAPVELPEPDTHCYDTDEERDVWSHSPDQMRTYGDAREAAGYARGVAEERERCAAICDRMGNPLNVKYEGGGCRKAAAAIRAAQKGDE